MKEFIKLIGAGAVSGLLVLFAGWYFSDVRDNIRIGIKVENLNTELDGLKLEVRTLSNKVSDIDNKYARIDERTKLTNYNQQQFKQTTEIKNIPQSKIDSARQYLNSMPSTKDAMNYLEMNLGFSPEEAKAVVATPQGGSAQMLKKD